MDNPYNPHDYPFMHWSWNQYYGPGSNPLRDGSNPYMEYDFTHHGNLRPDLPLTEADTARAVAAAEAIIREARRE